MQLGLPHDTLTHLHDIPGFPQAGAQDTPISTTLAAPP